MILEWLAGGGISVSPGVGFWGEGVDSAAIAVGGLDGLVADTVESENDGIGVEFSVVSRPASIYDEVSKNESQPEKTQPQIVRANIKILVFRNMLYSLWAYSRILDAIIITNPTRFSLFSARDQDAAACI